MWISRKKWEDMEYKVDALATIHETQRDRLENGLIPYFPGIPEYSFHFDSDISRSDALICDNVDEYYGKFIVEFLINRFSGTHSPDYFRLVKDDYVLYDASVVY